MAGFDPFAPFGFTAEVLPKMSARRDGSSVKCSVMKASSSGVGTNAALGGIMCDQAALVSFKDIDGIVLASSKVTLV